MLKLRIDELRDLVAYERVREGERARIIALKRRRRVVLGDRLSLLFENRDTVRFQIEEMVRAERLVDKARIAFELETYNGLLPDPGELSATLFVEIPEIARLAPQQARDELARFHGLEHAVRLELGARSVRAVFERVAGPEERMAAVHYLRFPVGDEGRRALADPAQAARLVVAHARYAAETPLAAETRADLVADLG